MRKFIFNPINDKTPHGAVEVGTEVKYSLRVSKFDCPTSAYFVMSTDNSPREYLEMNRDFVDDKYVHFSFTTKFTEIGFYWYHFEVKFGEHSVKLIRNDDLSVIESHADNDFLQLVIANESNADIAFRKGIIYHIFVDRFNRVGKVPEREGIDLIDDWYEPVVDRFDNNGDRMHNMCYGGTIKGITEKLPYLKKLNVGTIYLSPVFEGNSSHKYDVADYSKIDSMFGGKDAFVELIKTAKKMGIKIIIDGVFNHTGSDSIYFNKQGRYKTIGAYQSPNSKYYDWYDFSNYPNEYSCWWGEINLPQTTECESLFNYICGKNY